MKIKTLAGLIFAIFALVAVAQAQFSTQVSGAGATPGVSASQIDAIFSDLAPDQPGAAVLVLKDGKAIFQRGYGVRDLRTKTAIDAETNFRLASCTKQFTAMSIMLLAHDGKLRYEETLSDVWPDFPSYGKTVTLRNVLNHTSGLVAYEDVMDKQYAGVPDEKIPQIKDAGVLAIMKQQSATKFPPATKWEYSNSGYATLAMVVEKRSGKPFGEFLHDRIFAPLGMKNTVAYEKGRNAVENRAFGHSKSADGWKETDQSSTSAVLGDGGVYSSLGDLARWVAALDQHRLLSEKEMEPAYTPVKINGGAPVNTQGDASAKDPWDKPSPAYGFGWFLDPYKGHRRIYHDGSTIGGRTTIQRLPDDGIVVIILSNRGNFDPGKRAERIFDVVLAPK